LKELDAYESKLRETNSQELIQKIGDFEEFKSQHGINIDFEACKNQEKASQESKNSKNMNRNSKMDDPYQNLDDEQLLEAYRQEFGNFSGFKSIKLGDLDSSL
jgi:hypothetical protein